LAGTDAVRNVFDNFNYRIFYSLRYFRRLAAHALRQTRLFPQTVKNSRVRVGFCQDAAQKERAAVAAALC
jgi:hypothetical protein